MTATPRLFTGEVQWGEPPGAPGTPWDANLAPTDINIPEDANLPPPVVTFIPPTAEHGPGVSLDFSPQRGYVPVEGNAKEEVADYIEAESVDDEFVVALAAQEAEDAEAAEWVARDKGEERAARIRETLAAGMIYMEFTPPAIESLLAKAMDDYKAMAEGCDDEEAKLAKAEEEMLAQTPASRIFGEGSVPAILDAAAATYMERGKVYGDNYKQFGVVMTGMFPRGLALRSVDDWNRMGVLIQCASKLTRYSQSFTEGHVDSAHDLMVYAAMLEELTTAADADRDAARQEEIAAARARRSSGLCGND